MTIWRALLIAAGMTAGLPVAAQQSDLQRAFLGRYLDCAEAPGDRARLACFDALLAEIPAWLDATLPPPEGAAAPKPAARGPAPDAPEAPDAASEDSEGRPAAAPGQAREEAAPQPAAQIARRPCPKA